ncbi:MAG: 4-hydroxy-tetrahydrodipicolinate synthase [Lactobacillales bacterium]|jgi:4-hydroxy-tetrahydrodipicolinate synthase|nr:4-hydroxy-tetrahydrodipicolinate synthase [Lactobacillales bacterium]
MVLENSTIITALVTPFDEQGAIDFDRLPKLIEYLLANHTEGLILAGTTGESPTLTHDEEIELFKKVIEIVDGRVPLICGVGTNDTRDSVEFVKEVAQMKGISAGLAVVPYYNKPNQEGLYQHFKAIAKASDLPIIVYNVPGRTVASINVETTLRLAELPNIVAIKECAGLDAVTELVERAPKDFLVYTGEDSLAFATKAVGGQGVISVASHVLGTEIYEMYQALENGNLKHAAAIQRKLLPKMNALFSVPSPAPVKAILNHRGISVGNLRLPLVACTPEEAKTILSIVEGRS